MASAMVAAHSVASIFARQDEASPLRPDRGAGGTHRLNPVIVEDGTSRCLHFGPDYVQSRMCLDKPDELALEYTRKMMAFLLFCPKPRDLVIVGLGGGSLTKFCYRHLPRTQVTTIEISRDVIQLSPRFGVPPEDHRLRIVHADAVDYFENASLRADVILLDGCDEDGVAPVFASARFYSRIHSCLHHRGVLVANLVGSAQTRKTHSILIRATFGTGTIVIPAGVGANRVAFGFKDDRASSRWGDIDRKARKLSSLYDLDFPAYARLLRAGSSR